MPLLAQTFNNFGGLRLDAAIDEVGPDQAIDLLDVDWQGADGTLRNRDGATKITKADAPNTYRSIWRHSDTQLLTIRDKNYAVLDTEGKEAIRGLTSPAGEELVVGNLASAVFAAMGTPTASYTYFTPFAIGSEEPLGTVKFDGKAFSSASAKVLTAAEPKFGLAPYAPYLAVWPDGGNRMVYAGAVSGPAAEQSSNSHVWFSTPGNAEEFEDTAYVQLGPGNGEHITGCAVWGGQVFVAKRSKLFVFYGVSTDDEEGKPEFLYRSVNLPSPHFGGGSNGGQRMVAGNDGVYLLCSDGVYLTTGSTPVRISDALAPLISPRPIAGPAADTLGALRWSDFDQLHFFNDRLYLLSESIMLIYDIRRDAWLAWSTTATSLSPWNAGSGPDDLYFSSGKNVYRFDTETDEDPTVAMNPRWQSGFYDLGSDEEKVLTQARLWGSGEVSVATAKDFGETGAGKAFSLAAAPAIGSAQHQRTQHGVLHSHQFSGNGPWSVQRFVRYLEANRTPDTEAK